MRRLAAMASAVALSLCLAACSDPPSKQAKNSPPTKSSSAQEQRKISFGAFGPAEKMAALQQVVDAFNAASQDRQVELITWSDQEEALKAVQSGEVPDVFLTSRSVLREVADSAATRPVSQLLDERGIDFGDRYSRDALEAFSYDGDLQCMPYSISPMVIYYNTKLVDFAKMERRELDVPAVTDGVFSDRWTLEEFAAAARFATRHGDVDGVWIEPTLTGLAPFIYSGGGQVFNDSNEPTSLAFSDDSTRSALGRVLEILRDPTLTPSAEELQKTSALQRFKRGKLAMISGFRDLVPELRAVDKLSFDTISMPVIDGSATVGDIDALCLSADTEYVNDAADFLAYAVSDAALEVVTRTGYIVPANTQVAGSEALLGPGLEPAHASVFDAAIRGLIVSPLVPDSPGLEAAVDPLLQALLTSPGILDLDAATDEIDLLSRSVLDPQSVTVSPSP